MGYLPLEIPPGMVRPATVYDARGRWYDGNLVRFHDGCVQPWGGWVVSYASTGSGTRISDPIRGMFGWRVDVASLTRRLALGTYDNVYVWHEDGTMWDITPTAGLTAGAEHATSPGEAASWSFDAWGNDLVGCMRADGLIYTQPYLTPVAVMARITNSPSGTNAIVVTAEKFLFALGAAAFPRKVTWCDQDANTVWTPSATNQAGDFDIPGNGWLQAGARGRGETLLWTDTDLWGAVYVGGDLIYSFQPRGFQCGLISRRGHTVIDGKAFWMGQRSFHMYDGFVRTIECPVGDYVFNRLNFTQRSKVACVPNTDFGTVTWLYPGTAGASAENDSYVTYHYLLDCWSVGALARTDGIDKAFFDYAYMAGPSGVLYGHESGTAYTEEDSSTKTPYIESGPIELGNGDNVFMIRQYIPDEETLGEVNTRLYTRFYPTATETTNGPYTNANPTDVRVTARQVRVRHTQVTAGWRIGTPRLEVVPGGLR